KAFPPAWREDRIHPCLGRLAGGHGDAAAASCTGRREPSLWRGLLGAWRRSVGHGGPRHGRGGDGPRERFQRALLAPRPQLPRRRRLPRAAADLGDDLVFAARPPWLLALTFAIP